MCNSCRAELRQQKNRDHAAGFRDSAQIFQGALSMSRRSDIGKNQAFHSSKDSKQILRKRYVIQSEVEIKNALYYR